MADRKKVADKGNGKVSGAMSDGEKVAKNKNATSTEITDTDGGKQNIAEKNINENKKSETLDSALGDETVVTNEDGTTVRISKIKTESGKVLIKKTIVRKVVKPKTEDESKVAASNTEISNKEEVKDKAEIKTDKKKDESGRDENSAVKDVDAQIEESEDKSGADNEKDSSADSKKKEKKAKEKKERNKKSKESAEENDDSKEESEDKKVADEKEEDFALIEKQKKKLEAQQKKQEEAEAKKAFKEKLKMLKETPFVNVEAGADDGLNDEQVEERELRGMTNKVDNSISKSYLKIFTTNIFTLFNLLNIFLACLIIIFNGQIKNMLFAGIAMINLVIGIIQEIRSKRALDKLSLVSAPSIEAVRNGQVVEISTDDIVIDDIIILKQGSQIPTDCIVVGGECEANESLLTGEQDDIHKGIGDQLMSGSFVQSGKCRARVMAVGEDTYASKLMSEAKKFKKSKSELMRSINWIIRIATIIIFPLGILMFITNMKHATSISGAVTSTVSSVIGMIPEGLVMLTSVALALGIVRLAKKRTLVQDLYSIEALARVDVLCLDKTGTITEGSMQVESVHVYSSKFGSPDDIMANLVNALGKNNATFEACAEYFSSNETYKVSKLMPFSSARKWSGASFSGVGTFIVGAPEFVLKERYSLVERNVNEYAMEGYRVLVLVTTPESLQDGAMDPAKMELVALIVLSDKIRSTASATFEYFEQQGVQLKVISGDNPLTVSKVAERAGMKNAEKYIDASVDLDTPDKIYEAAEKYTVFGRVSPSQKKELVAALKAHGHTVGMTGDGVNDVMALKESDCSIAMASGSDASRNVAQLVLLDSDFSSLPSVVSEGRRVINNIERASSLFLVKTTFSAVLSLLLIIFQFSTYPFEPIQLTLINALFVGVPSFILALEPNDRRVKGNFLSKVFKRALPAGLTVAFAIILVCWMYNDIGFDVSPQISTMSVFITASVSFVVLVQVCMPYTKDKIFMLALLLVAFIFAVSNSFLSEKFSLVSLNSDMVLRLVIIIACILPIMAFMRVEIEAFKALFKETGGFIKREKDKAKNFFNRFDNKK